MFQSLEGGRIKSILYMIKYRSIYESHILALDN